MSLSKSENIFWKMILEQKKNASNKKEPQEPRHKVTFSKPMMKVNSSILDKIEKFNINSTPQSSLSKKSSKNKEQQELEKIEKLSTFNKIIKLQNLCKEMISSKERFSTNKTQLIDKINKNCYNYYKNKINMKEIYDYCQAKKPEEHIDYVLIEQPEKYFQDKYDNIYNFFFMLRNNNKMMLKLINNCNIENFEEISDFIVNFCYEDTINSSFIQEELMLIIYLIFEKNFFENLPEKINVDENTVSYNIFRNKNNILYYIIKSLTRKADIRNFLCSILVDDILKLEGYRKYLSPDIFSQNNFEDKDDFKENINKNEEDNFLKRYTINDKALENKLKLNLNNPEARKINRSITKCENDINVYYLKKIEQNKNKKDIEDKNKEDNKKLNENEQNNKDNDNEKNNIINNYIYGNYNIDDINNNIFNNNN